MQYIANYFEGADKSNLAQVIMSHNIIGVFAHHRGTMRMDCKGSKGTAECCGWQPKSQEIIGKIAEFGEQIDLNQGQQGSCS